MRKQILLLLTLTIVILTISGCGSPDPNTQNLSEEQIVWSGREVELLEGAAERIEHYRKGDATVLVVDVAGIPVTDAAVHMDMLKHDFLFGANLFILDLDKLPPKKQAIAQRQPGPSVIHHSDQGVQYASGDYVAELKSHGFEISMAWSQLHHPLRV